MNGAIRDYCSFVADRELLVRMEYERMGGRIGRKYDLNALPIRNALTEWKSVKHIPQTAPLSESERLEFELWMTAKRLEQKEKIL